VVGGGWSHTDSQPNYAVAAQTWYDGDFVQTQASLVHQSEENRYRRTHARVSGGPRFHDVGPISHGAVTCDVGAHMDHSRWGNQIHDTRSVDATLDGSVAFRSRYLVSGSAGISHERGDSTWSTSADLSANTDDRLPLTLYVGASCYKYGTLESDIVLYGQAYAKAGGHVRLGLAGQAYGYTADRSARLQVTELTICPSIDIAVRPEQRASLVFATDRILVKDAAGTPYYWWPSVFGLSYSWDARSRSTQRVLFLQRFDLSRGRVEVGNSEWLTKLSYLFSF